MTSNFSQKYLLSGLKHQNSERDWKAICSSTINDDGYFNSLVTDSSADFKPSLQWFGAEMGYA